MSVGAEHEDLLETAHGFHRQALVRLESKLVHKQERHLLHAARFLQLRSDYANQGMQDTAHLLIRWQVSSEICTAHRTTLGFVRFEHVIVDNHVERSINEG